MKNMKLYVYGLIVICFTLSPALPASAESNGLSEAHVKQNLDEKREDRQQKVQEKKQLLAAKLTDVKKKVCEKRLSNIKKIMTNAHERGERHLEVFTIISDRVKTFYEDKQYSVDNYTDLVTALDEKKQSAMIAVAMSGETIDQFSCDGDDPLAIKDLFKAQIYDQNTALKAYKTAVKDLIVAIKSSNSQQSDKETN